MAANTEAETSFALENIKPECRTHREIGIQLSTFGHKGGYRKAASRYKHGGS